MPDDDPDVIMTRVLTMGVGNDDEQTKTRLKTLKEKRRVEQERTLYMSPRNGPQNAAH